MADEENILDTIRAEEEEYNKEKKGEDDNKKDSDKPPKQASGSGGSTFSPTFLLENVKSPHFWAWVIVISILLFIAWSTNFLKSRDILSAFMNTYGFTLLGLITIFVMICFILYGWFVPPYNLAKFYIATALFIWMLDLVPQIDLPIIRWLGSTYQGFEFPFRDVSAIWSIPWLPIVGSSFTFAFLYIQMVYKIIKKEYIVFILSFGLIILFNYLTNQLPNYLSFSFTFPYGKIIFLGLLIFFGWLAWKFDKKRTGEEIPEFFSSLYLIFVFSFFWLNTGWQGNVKAWFHVLFIIAFGFGYIKPTARTIALAYISIATLLFIDFYGYGLLYSSDILALQFIPPLVIFVIWYCYHIETEKGTKNYTYPVAAFILLVTFILLMSVSIGGTTSAEVPFTQRKGVDYKDLFTQFKEKFTNALESRLEFATGGYYRGSVENNRFESLGVYFANIRAADPRFYTDEPITVWGSIRSKTYKDAVIVNFSCYRLKDSKRIRADKIIPGIKFPIFSLEEVDTECTFLPKTEKTQEIPAGANTITFSAEYNFGTDAYLKTYFIDRERYRAYVREDIDPLKEVGIKDRKSVAVFTNGPVEIGMSTTGISTGEPLITVSEGATIKPSIGITLTNRQEIQDKDKRIIQKWEGKIKNITELILLVPPGIKLPNIDGCKSKDVEERLKNCPCTMPFEPYTRDTCVTSCSVHIMQPCNKACIDSNSVESEQKKCIDECETAYNRCTEECTFLFQVNEGEGPTNQKYTGYALDVGSIEFRDLNRDIDKHRSFSCRFDPSPAVLDNTPITTRYFRVRARYNYLLENSVVVPVEQLPIEVVDRVPDAITKSLADIKPGHELWFEGFSLDLISAIALKESGWKHCCAESGKNKAGSCKPSDEPTCGDDKILTSYTPPPRPPSIGIMQINKKNEGIAASICKSGQTIYDKECNILVGIKILKDGYQQYGSSGIPKTRLEDSSKLKGYCPSGVHPDRHNRYIGYRGISVALRAYNGLGCRPESDCQKACTNSKTPTTCVNSCVEGTVNYVEKILDTARKIKDGEIIDQSGIRSILTSEDVQSIHQEETEIAPAQKPAPVSGILADDTPNARNSITITWLPSSTPNTQYKLVRYNAQTSESSKSYFTTDTKFIDTDVQDGIEYYYKISTISDYDESDLVQGNIAKSIDDSITFTQGGP